MVILGSGMPGGVAAGAELPGVFQLGMVADWPTRRATWTS